MLRFFAISEHQLLWGVRARHFQPHTASYRPASGPEVALEEHIDVLPVFMAAFRPCTGTVVCVARFPH